MSLIFGLNLPKRIYLVSDSRLTRSDGSWVDDFAKWNNLNSRLVVVAANSASMASYVVRRLRDELDDGSTFNDLEQLLIDRLHLIATSFYSETGLISHSAAFIFAGYDAVKKTQVDSGLLGAAMSAPLVSQGEGAVIESNIDSELLAALQSAIVNATTASPTGKLEPGTLLQLDTPMPRMVAVYVKATNQGVDTSWEEVSPYEAIAFNPQFKTERLRIPLELIGQIDFADRSGKSMKDGLYEDATSIINYVHTLLQDKHWPTVGGTTVPIAILPNGSTGIAVGQLARKDVEGNTVLMGGTGVIDGKLHYYDELGKLKPYRFLYDYFGPDEAKI